MKHRKKTFMLLEVMIGLVLLGMILTGLMEVFFHSVKNNVKITQIKRRVLETSLFQQKMKVLFDHKPSVWLNTHPNSQGAALFIRYKEAIDPEFSSPDRLGMLYVDDKKMVHFVTWAGKEEVRTETLLEDVMKIHYLLFDSESGKWEETWSKKKKTQPEMLKIQLHTSKNIMEHAFFLADPAKQITYSGPP